MSKWIEKEDLVNELIKDLKCEQTEREFYHYTSLKVLFSILENDSFWISNVRFSNDDSEERLVKEYNENDDYMICFCDGGDRLSQWRGYCHDGGAAIKFDIIEPMTWNVLHADYENSKKFERYENLPLPVIYVRGLDKDSSKASDEMSTAIKRIDDANGISIEEMIPYLKNKDFIEERELRMAFVNSKGSLSQCIRFRSLENGVKIPYMIVKNGDIGKMLGNCMTNPNMFTDDILTKYKDEFRPIWIEEGNNQEKVYFEMLNKVKEYKEKHGGSLIKIYCRGHLPIESITVAPTNDRNRIKEEIERFCKSKYWLRNVKVLTSQIPYMQR